LIPASAVPKNFEGLLNPQLKGKMGMTTSETGVRMMGAMLKFKGEEFAKKLKTQDISLHSVSGRAMADMAIAGEVPISASIFRDHAMESRARRTDNWVPMEGCQLTPALRDRLSSTPSSRGDADGRFYLSRRGRRS
jgi:ABC-type Fe3+ transport system substrate-binding protein